MEEAKAQNLAVEPQEKKIAKKCKKVLFLQPNFCGKINIATFDLIRKN
jgi:hypothetical protein